MQNFLTFNNAGTITVLERNMVQHRISCSLRVLLMNTILLCVPFQTFFFPSMHRSSLSSISAIPSDASTTNSIHGFNNDIQPLVTVPSVPCPLTDTLHQQLRSFVDPLDNSVDPLGVTHYLRTIAFLDANRWIPCSLRQLHHTFGVTKSFYLQPAVVCHNYY